MSEMYQINPVDVNRQYSYFKVFIQNVTLFTGANISVELYDQNKKIIESKYINLTQQEYQGWAADDEYIVDIVATKLGYTLYTSSTVDPSTVVIDPAPVDPAPVDPAPVDPVTVDPAPVDPAPVDPAPVDPAPVDPAPVDPAPVDPAPVDPAPVDPSPVDPEPVDPEPTV